MKLEKVATALIDELHQLGIEAEKVDGHLCFEYLIDKSRAPLCYEVHLDKAPYTLDVLVHWDLVASPLTSELLTFLSYLNSVEKYGHFYVESKDSKVYYRMIIFYRDLSPEIERTRRLFSMPVRAFGSGSNALRAILQEGEPVINVYHWWMKDVLDKKEAERTESPAEVGKRLQSGVGKGVALGEIDADMSDDTNGSTDANSGADTKKSDTNKDAEKKGGDHES